MPLKAAMGQTLHHPQEREGSVIRNAWYLLLWLLPATVMALEPVSVQQPLLRVGYYDNSPKIYRNESGQPDGFWPALVEELARSEGWRVAWVYGSWDELTDELAQGKLDVLPDVALTDERAGRFVFNNEVVLVSWSRVYVRQGIKAQTLPDLKDLRVAVLRDSVNYRGDEGIAELLSRFQVPVTFVEYDSYAGVFEALASGDADAGVTNKDFGARYESEYAVSRTPIIFSPASLYFAFPPEGKMNAELIARIDQELVRMKGNNASHYYFLLDHYLGVRAADTDALPSWLVPLALSGALLLVLLAFGNLVLNSQVRLRNRALVSVSRDKHLAEDQAERHAQQLKAFFENSPTAAYIKNTLGEFQMANRDFIRLLNRPVADIRGQTLADLMSLQDAQAIEENENSVLRSAEPERFEEHIHHGGERRTYLSNKFPLHDRRGRMFGLGSVSLDITDQRAEEHLREIQWRVLDLLSRPETQLGEALQCMLDTAVEKFGEQPVLIIRRDSDVLHVAAATGLDQAHAAAVDEALCCMFKVVQSSTERHLVVDVMERHCHGALKHLGSLVGLRYAHLYPVACRGERDAAVLVYLSAEQALASSLRRRLYANMAQILQLTLERHHDRQEQALASAIYSATSDALVVVDTKERIVRVNSAFVRLMGGHESDYPGQRYRQLVGGDTSSVLYDDDSEQVHLREVTVQCGDAAHVLLERVAPHFNGLNAVAWYIVLLTDVTHMKESQAEIDFLSQHDSLTRLPNRHRLHQLLEKTILESERDEEPFALAFMDLDRFKDINESLGHSSGDAILREVAHRLKELLRTDDYVARVGGDEFVAILRNVSDRQGLDEVLDKLLQSFRKPIELDGREVFTGVSIGTALYPDDGTLADELLRNADIAMNEAKARGRNRASRFYPALVEAASLRFELDAAMRTGLEQGEFSLMYQPQVDLASLRLAGLEALVRWHRPGNGPVSPAVFIPIAEASGRIVEIDDWVLNEACRQARLWQDAGIEFHRISVNLSALDLGGRNIVERILSTIERHGISPSMLGVEVTESTVMENVDAAFERLRALRDAGVFVSIDDFGTGYSSLSYLKRLQVNELKIDKSFIDDLPLEENDRAICEAIIQMGRHLGLEVIAEGVETASQASFLQDEGCSRAQGYWFAKPQTPDELVVWMNEWLL